MNLIPDGSIATLVAVDCAATDHQIPNTMGMYSYQADDNDPELWHLADLDKDADGSLRVDSEGRKISIYGASNDNIQNVNNIAQMLGWKTCQLFGKNSESESDVLRRLVNVKVLNAPQSREATPPASATPTAPRPPAPPLSQEGLSRPYKSMPSDPATSVPARQDFDAQDGTVDAGARQLASVSEAIEDRAHAEAQVVQLEETLRQREQELTALEGRCSRLEEENAALKTVRPSGATPTVGRSDALLQALLAFAEGHLGQCIADGTDAGRPLLTALKAHGFDLRVNIVPATA